MTARVQSQCSPSCSRYRSPFNPANTTGGIMCAAFPTGIPDKIWNNQVDHRNPVDGDHGLQWLAAPGYTYPTYALMTDGQPSMVAAAIPTHTGAMVALVPADPYLLETPGGEPADLLHCTLLFLGEADQLDADARAEILATCEDLAAEWPEIVADGFGLAVFNPTGDDPCLTLLLSGDDLADLQSAVAAEVETDVEQHEPWHAHVTLAYTDDIPMISDLIGLAGPVTFDRLRVAFGDEVTDYQLSGVPDEPVVDEPPPTEVVEEEDEPLAEVAAAWDAADKHLTAPPTMTTGGVRVRWDGCPNGLHPVHDGPCPDGL